MIPSNSFPNMGTYTLSKGRIFRPTLLCIVKVSYHLYHIYSVHPVFVYILLKKIRIINTVWTGCEDEESKKKKRQQLSYLSNDHQHLYLLATHLIFLALSDFVFGKTFWLSCDVSVMMVYLTPELETVPSIFAALTFYLNDGPALTSGNDIFVEMVTEIMLAPINQFPASFLNLLCPWLLPSCLHVLHPPVICFHVLPQIPAIENISISLSWAS